MEANRSFEEHSFEFYRFVFMPHNPHNVILKKYNGKRINEPRWVLIEGSLNILQRDISLLEDDKEKIFFALKNCILVYNPNLRCNFNILEDLCKLESTESYLANSNLSLLLLSIVKAALKLPYLFKDELPLLRQGSESELSLTSEQVHCLLANAFLCTFPKRDSYHHLYANYPRINFTNLFDDSDNIGSSWLASARKSKLNKLMCFSHYFNRMKERQPDIISDSVILYERRKLFPGDLIDWGNSPDEFSRMYADARGSIETSRSALQVDFANKLVGGGTLGNGSVMEEIRFATCPSLVASQLFVESLDDQEVLLVHGFEQFSSYTGYGATFEFAEDFKDTNVKDNHIVAMDAYRFSRRDSIKQFEKDKVDRELNKCLCAFKIRRNSKIALDKVASGKWGCGVFNGDPQLKCLIQWMAASVSNVTLELYTFGDTKLSSEMNSLAELLQRTTCTVGQMYKLVLNYGLQLQRQDFDGVDLLGFVTEQQNMSTTLENKTEFRESATNSISENSIPHELPISGKYLLTEAKEISKLPETSLTFRILITNIATSPFWLLRQLLNSTLCRYCEHEDISHSDRIQSPSFFSYLYGCVFSLYNFVMSPLTRRIASTWYSFTTFLGLQRLPRPTQSDFSDDEDTVSN